MQIWLLTPFSPFYAYLLHFPNIAKCLLNKETRLWVFPHSIRKETPELGKIIGFSLTWTLPQASFSGLMGNITEMYVQASQSYFLWIGRVFSPPISFIHSFIQ